MRPKRANKRASSSAIRILPPAVAVTAVTAEGAGVGGCSCAGISDGANSLGRRIIKRLPRPITLSTVISPFNKCTKLRLIARPKPEPPYLRLVEPSNYWKAPKTCSSLSAGIPMPGIYHFNLTIVINSLDAYLYRAGIGEFDGIGQ